MILDFFQMSVSLMVIVTIVCYSAKRIIQNRVPYLIQSGITVTSTNQWVKHCKHSNLCKEMKIVYMGEKILNHLSVCVYIEIVAQSCLARYFIYTPHVSIRIKRR